MRLFGRGRSRAAVSTLALALLLHAALVEGFAEDAAATPGPAAPDEALAMIFPAVVTVAGDSAPDQAAVFGAALKDALARGLGGASFRLKSAPSGLEPGQGLTAQASSLALAAGARWAAVPTLELSDKRLAYTLCVYDASERALVASAGFSTYAGLTALPLMDDSARTVAAKASAFRSSGSHETGLVQYSLKVSCPEEGASVYLGRAGQAGARLMGTIQDGGLDLPYLPLKVGTRIVVGVSAKNRQPVDKIVELGESAPEVSIGALPILDRENLLLGTGPGRFLGLGASYRIFLRPGWNFLFFNEKLFAGYDFSAGSSPVYHLESWEGWGSYLIFPPQSRFRMGASVGWGALFSFSSATAGGGSGSVFVDVALLPMEAFFEYRLTPGLSAWLSVRGEYSVNSAGLLGMGWIGNGTPDLGAGILWRR